MLISFALAILLSPAPQGQVKSADEVLRRLVKNDPSVTSDEDDRAFVKLVTDYEAQSGQMAPAVAAEKWLELIDEAHKQRPRPAFEMSMGGGFPGMSIRNITTVADVLPRPEVWPEIVRIVKSRPDDPKSQVLLMLFDRLRGDDDAVVRRYRGLLDSYAKGKTAFSTPLNTATPLIAALERKGDYAGIVDEIVREMTVSPYQENAVPDLATLEPRGVAKEQLLRLLRVARKGLNIDGTATQALAREVVLEHLAELKIPHYEFARGVEDAAYVRRLVDRYGIVSLLVPDGPGEEGGWIYLADLLLRGDVAGAANLVRRSTGPNSLDQALEREDSPQLFAKLFTPLLSLHRRMPERDLWWGLAAAAIASGNADRVAGEMRALARDPKRSVDDRLKLYSQVREVDQASGDIAAIVQDLQEMAVLRPSWASDELFKTGLLLKRSDLVEAGIRQSLPEANSGRNMELFKALIDRGRYAELQQLLIKTVQQELAAPGSRGIGDEYGYRLVSLYHHLERPADAMNVLANFDYWSQNDLGKLLSEGPYLGPLNDELEYAPLGFYAAWALAKSGQRQVAIEALHRLLLQIPNCDEAGELLNELEGEAALPFYDSLIRCDLYEAKPRIWKADLLRRMGKLDSAEQEVRRAIALDPADAKAKPRHRFTAYRVLARILHAKGDTRGEREADQVWNAGQLAQRAAEFVAEGLFGRAAEMYKAAVQSHPVDFVAEASLAECLQKQGRLAESTSHRVLVIERLAAGLGPATELPDNVEAVFEDPAVLRAIPSKLARVGARSSYAKAFLEAQIGRRSDAVRDLREVVSKEPDHLGAWQMLSDLDRDGSEAATRRVLQLRPARLNRRTTDLRGVHDLGSVYSDYETWRSGLPKRDQSPLFRVRSRPGSAWSRPLVDWNLLEPALGLPAGAFLMREGDVSSIVGLYDQVGQPGRGQ